MTTTPLTTGKQYLTGINITTNSRGSINDFIRDIGQDVWSATRNSMERNIQRELETRLKDALQNFIVPNVNGTSSISSSVNGGDGTSRIIDVTNGSAYIQGRKCTIPSGQQHTMTITDGSYYLLLHVLNFGANESFELVDLTKAVWTGTSNKEQYIILADITMSGGFATLVAEATSNYVGGNTPMPIGTILMYNGTGIANVAARTVQLGDESGDAVFMNGWFVCNGNASTPNLIGKFIRGEASSGNIGGSDTNVHTHTLPTTDDHVLTIPEMPSHSHNYTIFSNAVGAGVIPPTAVWRGVTTAATELTGGDAGHKHSIGNITTSISNSENRPAYYSVIFIIRKT